MSLSPGSRVGSYEIRAPLGQGGMGEVYLAFDSRLDREVAIKALPDHLTHDPERLSRFEREAKVMASLNHTNVGQIYGLEEAEGHRYLVLEFVDGETLAARLGRGPIPLAEALPLARQIADGVAAAHEKNVVHRDLKPANIMIAGEGDVKVLDFGLARADEELSGASSIDSPTMTTPAQSPTIAGVILGTAGYMSPEQARGRRVDKRSDVFSFGCVLYEMLTGAGPFAGETVTDSLGAVLHKDPDWSKLPADTPRLVRLLLTRCLAKDRRQRLQDIGDARVLIDEALSSAPETSAAATTPAASSWQRYAWPAAALVAVAVAAWSLLRPVPAGDETTVRSVIELPSGANLRGRDASIALSPDGRTLAFAANVPGAGNGLWIRPLDSLTSQLLAGTEGATSPFWSPDGRDIGFFARGSLYRIPATGGTATALASAPEPRGGSWGENGTIVFSPEPFGPLFTLSENGGTPIPVTSTEATERASDRWPHFLPGGRTLLFCANATDRIMYLDLDTGTSTEVVAEGSQGIFAPPDRLLFIRGTQLMAQPFDPATGHVSGDAAVVATDVWFDVLRAAGVFTASAGGRLIYRPSPVRDARLEWFDMDGRSLGAFGPVRPYGPLWLSPNGRQIASRISSGTVSGGADLWVFDTIQGLGSKFADAQSTGEAVWSPDNRRVAYSNGRTTIIRSVDGSGEDIEWSYDPRGIVDAWSHDGTQLVTWRQLANTGYDLFLTRPEAQADVKTLVATPVDEQDPRFSPDDKWIAFRTPDGTHVVPADGSSPPRQVLTNGAQAWLDDWSLVYVDNRKLMKVAVRFQGNEFTKGDPVELFGGRDLPQGPRAITSDGQRLLVAAPVGEASSTTLTLVEHWRSQR